MHNNTTIEQDTEGANIAGWRDGGAATGGLVHGLTPPAPSAPCSEIPFIDYLNAVDDYLTTWGAPTSTQEELADIAAAQEEETSAEEAAQGIIQQRYTQPYS
jgi:hypothetical protein